MRARSPLTCNVYRVKWPQVISLSAAILAGVEAFLLRASPRDGMLSLYEWSEPPTLVRRRMQNVAQVSPLRIAVGGSREIIHPRSREWKSPPPSRNRQRASRSAPSPPQRCRIKQRNQPMQHFLSSPTASKSENWQGYASSWNHSRASPGTLTTGVPSHGAARSLTWP